MKTAVTQCEPVYNGHLKDIDKWSFYRDAVLKTLKKKSKKKAYQKNININTINKCQ